MTLIELHSEYPGRVFVDPEDVLWDFSHWIGQIDTVNGWDSRQVEMIMDGGEGYIYTCEDNEEDAVFVGRLFVNQPCPDLGGLQRLRSRVYVSSSE